MPLIEFDRVSKSFSHTGGAKLLRAHVEARFQPKSEREVFWALRDVSFHVDERESIAVIGSNGAGKSTLLSLVAGLCQPTSGRVTVNGRVAALLQLGAGFHQDLTGAENVRLNASLLGLSRKRTEAAFDGIVEFSGIGDFIHESIRTYSSGMIMRLAFSVAVHVDPDILIVDEVLAVGDQEFQEKCFGKIVEFRKQGKTLLFVSHGPELIRKLCDRAILLEHGRAVLSGGTDAVLSAYQTGAVTPAV